MTSTIEKFIALAGQGLNSTEIALQLGVSRQRVQQLKIKTGVTLPPAPRGAPPGQVRDPTRWGNGLKIASTWVGAAGELLAAAELIQRGYYVYQTVARTGPFDLAAYRDGKFIRVEVRSIRTPNQNCNMDWSKADLLARVLPDGRIQWSPFEP